MTRPTSSEVSSEIDFSIVSLSRNNSLINDCAWSRLFIVGPRITHTRVELSESLGSDLIDIHTLHTSYKKDFNFNFIENSDWIPLRTLNSGKSLKVKTTLSLWF